MTEKIGTHAMILAAGLGLRMRPLTDHKPKPLIEVAGKPLIDYGMDRLREAEVQRAVVNGHYLADQILAWSKQQTSPEIIFSDERAEILDTGGGIAKALPLLGEQPFFVLNSDSFWVDGKVPSLSRLRNAWDGATMDCLLLLCHVDRTIGYDGRGDFLLGRDGRLVRQQWIGSPCLYRRLSRPSSPFCRCCCRKILDECFVGQGNFRRPLAWHGTQRKMASCGNACRHCLG